MSVSLGGLSKKNPVKIVVCHSAFHSENNNNKPGLEYVFKEYFCFEMLYY
jgi:hypothetical protein